jgi:hypothetical protein
VGHGTDDRRSDDGTFLTSFGKCQYWRRVRRAFQALPLSVAVGHDAAWPIASPGFRYNEIDQTDVNEVLLESRSGSRGPKADSDGSNWR